MSINKIVLAYSGGLDTSVILKWLMETYQCPVVAYAADLGQGEELSEVAVKAKATGAAEVHILDLKEEFARDFIFPMFRANALYEGAYLLGTSIARPLIAKAQVEVAKKTGADAVSHGATGKGNDQVRFELTYMALAPKLTIIAPWKDPSFELTSREAAIEYAKAHKVPIAQTKKKIYSRDRNLWHISHEGADLEDPANEPKDNLWVMSVPVSKAPAKGEYVEVTFKQGRPVAVNGKGMAGDELVMALNEIGGRNAVGQTDLVENRLVGIKSRELYETPAATILLAAHRDLESLTLDRETAHYKQAVALKYADLVYNGQWFCELREALDAFVASTQRNVTGTVRVKCLKGRATVAGVTSPKSLYSGKLASFTMGSEYTPSDATGFIKLFGLQMRGRGR
ncbi:MAG TPA: argininosuccinate synthase [Desulfobacterales bacterium]|nr:argininosuccinate synthase [Desulfobacterales bacterium]